MPYCSCNSEISLHYTIHGSGFPLLLVSGLSGGTWSWMEQVPFFQNHYKVITFDNRGAGRSSIPPGPYTIAGMARDALCLLDHLGVESAFVLGVSMGGMIAQEIALQAPGRVRALILGCTHCGGAGRIAPPGEAIQTLLHNDGLTREQITEKNIPLFLSENTIRTRPDVVRIYRRLQARGAIQPDYAFHAQLRAIDGFDCGERLPELRIPVLIISGTEDILVPAANSRYLAERIPGAKLIEIQGAGHAIHVECRDELNEFALEFYSKLQPAVA